MRESDFGSYDEIFSEEDTLKVSTLLENKDMLSDQVQQVLTRTLQEIVILGEEYEFDRLDTETQE